MEILAVNVLSKRIKNLINYQKKIVKWQIDDFKSF
jgi:hypothetical protein